MKLLVITCLLVSCATTPKIVAENSEKVVDQVNIVQKCTQEVQSKIKISNNTAWQMCYNVERDRKKINWARSNALSTWFILLYVAGWLMPLQL